MPGYLLQQVCPSPANYSSRYNAGMLSRRLIRYLTITVALLVMAGISLSAQEKTRRGRKYKPPPPTSKVEITVVRASDSKPIENAAVIFHVDMDGDKGNMELKTNEDGKSVIDVLPIGSVEMVSKPSAAFKIHLKDMFAMK